jgi:hypothetical protein
MVYDFDGLAKNIPDKCESIWTISGSEVEIELEDRPALIRGRTRSDGVTRNERKPRSLSASRRRIASAVANFVGKPKFVEEGFNNEEKSVVEFEENAPVEASTKSTTRFRRDSTQQKKIEDSELRQHDMQEVDQISFGNRQAPRSVDIEEKSEKAGGVGSAINMIGRVLSPKKLSRKKVMGTLATIDVQGRSPPESPRSPEKPSHTGVVVNNPQFLGSFGDEESMKNVDSPSKNASWIVSPLKAFGQRAFGSRLRHQVSGKTDATGDSHEMASNAVMTPLDNQPVGILRASTHRPVRRPSIENGSTSQDRNLVKESIGGKKAILGSSEHGTRSTSLIENDDIPGKYSRTVSSLVSPRRKMASRKLDSAEILQRVEARRQSGTGSTSDTKRKGSSRTISSQISSDSREKPERQFSESSGNTSASRLTTRTCGPSLQSDRKRLTRESSRGRPRRSLETRSDHVSTTRRRSSSAFPTSSLEARGKPQRRFSESPGNTATSKSTTKTCRPTLHAEGKPSRKADSRGRTRKSMETRSDHVSTNCRSSSSKHSRKSSEARGQQHRRFSEGSGNTLPTRLTTRMCDTKRQSERTLSEKELFFASARKIQEVNSNYTSADDPTSERSRTPSKKKSSWENLMVSPPAATERKEGSTQMERRSISNRSTTPRKQSSLDDSKRQKEAVRIKSSESTDRSRSGQRTRQTTNNARRSNAKDLRSSLNDNEMVIVTDMITGDSDDKQTQHLRANAKPGKKTNGGEMESGTSKSETSNTTAELDDNRFTSFRTEDCL